MYDEGEQIIARSSDDRKQDPWPILDAGSKAKPRQVLVTPGRWCLDLPSGHLIGFARYADLSEHDLPQPSISLAGPPSKSDGFRVQCHVWLLGEPVEAGSPMALRTWKALHPGAEFHGYTEAEGGRVPFHWEITALGPVREKLKDLAVELGISKPKAAPKPNSRAAIAATLKQHMPELIDRLFAGNDTRAEDKGRIRFGTHGSLSIDPDTGLWYDFEATKGGGPLELIAHIRGCSIGQAASFGHEILEGKELVEPEPLRSPEERRAAAKSELQRAQAGGQAKIAESLQWLLPLDDASWSYLAKRGIDIAFEDLGKWSMLRTKRASRKSNDPLWQNAALVFVATGPENQPLALQYVFVEPTGIRVHPEPHQSKRTLGCKRSAAVKFPGDERVLFVVDGPEDALSLSFHGGVEAWAVLGGLGAAAILELGIARDRQVLLFGDNDAKGSAGWNAPLLARDALRSAGHTAFVARPPAGIKDANALLKEAGPEKFRQFVTQIKARIEACQGG